MAHDIFEGTKELCYFCGQTFNNSFEKEDHILNHLKRRHCFGCDNELISIGDKWYQLHDDINCNTIKLEPINNDTEMQENADVSPAMSDHSLSNEPNKTEVFDEAMSFEEIMLPESNASANVLTESLAKSRGVDESTMEDDKSNLKSILPQLSIRKPFSCPHCSAGYCHLSSLSKHMRRVHRTDGEPLNTTKATQRNQPIGANQPIVRLQQYKCRFCKTKYHYSYRFLDHVKKYHKQWFNEFKSRKTTSGAMESEPTASDFNESSGDEEPTASAPVFDNDISSREIILSESNAPGNVLTESLAKSRDVVASTIKDDVNNLKSILAKISSTKPYPCSYCSAGFSHSTSLSKHVRSVHRGDKQRHPNMAEAKQQNQPIKSKGYIQSVLRLHKYKCRFCGTKYYHSFRFLDHVKKYHKQEFDELKLRKTTSDSMEIEPTASDFNGSSGDEEPTASAAEFDEVMSSKEVMLPESNAPENTPTESLANSTVVGESTMKDDVINLKSILTKIASSKPFQCSQCSIGYSHSNSLSKHMRTVHKNESDPLNSSMAKAKQQNQPTKSIGSIQSVLRLQQYKCRFCETKYCHSYRFLDHVKKYHKQEFNELKLRKTTSDSIEPEPTVSDFIESSGDEEAEAYAESQSPGMPSTSRQVKPFQCTCCLSRFAHDSSLAKHRKLCGGQISLEVAWKSASEENRSLAKYNADMWTCGFCSSSFNWERNAHKHLQSIHGSSDKAMVKSEVKVQYMRMWYCSICFLTSIHEVSLHAHLFSKHRESDRKHVRSIKDWQDPDQLQLDAGEKVSCGFCRMTFSDIDERNQHKREQHMHEVDDQTVIKCTHCEDLFNSRDRYQIHSILVHSVLDKIYLNQLECIICSASFQNAGTFMAHIREHQAMDNYRCCMESCELQFDTIDQLRLHLNKHPKADETRQKCDKCSCTFTKSAFSRHRCNGVLCFCDICGKQFGHLRLLKLHMNRHTRSKMYKCSYCPREFTNAGVRLTHQRIHTGERPCKCTEPNCGKAFVQHADLHRHQYRAHGIFRKKYPCTLCTQVFPEHAMLRKHLARHEP